MAGLRVACHAPVVPWMESHARAGVGIPRYSAGAYRDPFDAPPSARSADGPGLPLRAARSYGARQSWRRTVRMSGGFLLMGLIGLTTESAPPSGGMLTIFAAALVIVGSLTERHERGMG